MKKISKIAGMVIVFLLTVCNTCFADIAIVDPDKPKNNAVNNAVSNTQDSNILTYAIIGALIGVVVVCAIIVIKTIVDKKKEK